MFNAKCVNLTFTRLPEVSQYLWVKRSKISFLSNKTSLKGSGNIKKNTLSYIQQNSQLTLCRYIHNWALQPFSEDFGLDCHTIQVVCLNLYLSGGTYSLTSTPIDRFLRNFSWQCFIYSQSICQKSAERKSPKKYFLIFRFVGHVCSRI